MTEIIEKVKVIYNQATGIVTGYYSNEAIIRTNSTVDEVNLTLTNSDGTFPYIEIAQEEKDLKKDVMQVIGGVYQEYIKPDAELLQEAKDAKIAQIKSNNKAFIYLPVDYNGSTFLNTEISGKNLETAFNFIDEPIQWLDINGNVISLTKLQVKDLITLMINHRSTGYFLEASLINQVVACATILEVNNIDITF